MSSITPCESRPAAMPAPICRGRDRLSRRLESKARPRAGAGECGAL
jgi:hypothetical protein